MAEKAVVWRQHQRIARTDTVTVGFEASVEVEDRVVAVMVALTAWLAPPEPASKQATVSIPIAVYERLALQAQGRTGADGRPLTVGQVIEELAAGRQ